MKLKSGVGTGGERGELNRRNQGRNGVESKVD